VATIGVPKQQPGITIKKYLPPSPSRGILRARENPLADGAAVVNARARARRFSVVRLAWRPSAAHDNSRAQRGRLALCIVVAAAPAAANTIVPSRPIVSRGHRLRFLFRDRPAPSRRARNPSFVYSASVSAARDTQNTR